MVLGAAGVVGREMGIRGGDGGGFCVGAYVLRCARGVGAPIYLFSALDDEELAARAAAIEIEGFISKRIGIDRIVERVRAILEERT